MQKHTLVLSLLMAVIVTCATAAEIQHHDPKVSLSLAQSHKLAQASEQIAKVRSDHPNTTVAVRINGELLMLQGDEQLIDRLELGVASRLWIQYVQILQTTVAETSVRALERLRVVLDQQLFNAVNAISRPLLGVEVARTCQRAC